MQTPWIGVHFPNIRQLSVPAQGFGTQVPDSHALATGHWPQDSPQALSPHARLLQSQLGAGFSGLLQAMIVRQANAKNVIR